MPFVSIIIPCYNVEKYLNDCIRSVVGQTFTDWEAILVDDGSSDKTPEICDSWAQKDRRIKVIHQKNQGVSAARNNALMTAEGKFVCFVDSDDTVGPNYLKALIETQQQYQSQLTVSGFILLAPAKSFKQEYKVSETHFDKSAFIELFSSPQYLPLLRPPYCKLFELEIIKAKDLRFDPNVHYGEDTIFVLQYCLFIDSISFSSDVSYNYYRRPTGLVNKKCYRKDVVSEIKAFTQIFQVWGNRLNSNYTDILYFRDTLSFLYERFRRGYSTGMSLKEYINSYDYLNLQIYNQYYPAKTMKSKLYWNMLRYTPKLLGSIEYHLRN